MGPVVKVNGYGHHVDNMGVAAHTAAGVMENLDLVFHQHKKESVKASNEKCQFRILSIGFLG